VLLIGCAVVVIATAVLILWGAGGSSRRSVAQLDEQSRRKGGVASGWVVRRRSGRRSVRRRMTVLKPSTRQLTAWQRLRVPTLELATPVARVGRQRVWAPCEDVELIVGGPRTGKSGAFGCRILDAPGAVIVTSTRTDLIEVTGSLREGRGPVWVFNPSSLGGLESTIVFDPLTGCTDPKTAAERASDLLSGTESAASGGGDRVYWQAQAVRVLSGLMHAAALTGASMTDVQRWVAAPDEHAEEIQRCLRLSSMETIRVDVLQFVNTNDRTRTSITSTIMPALAWLNDQVASAAAGVNTIPRPELVDGQLKVTDRAGFDVAELLASRATVYLLGAEDSQVAPLVCALTGHIARTARQLASERQGGRLDPPLTLVLDEAALICPIPLDKWTADMGGRNITIHIAVQSRAQLRHRWGDTGAAAIINNAATLLVFGGGRDTDDLAVYSTLTGERHVRQAETRRGHGQRAVTTTSGERVPVLTAAQIAQLEAGRVVIFRRGMPPALGTVEMAWNRRDVRAATRTRTQRSMTRHADRQATRAVRRAAWVLRRASIRRLVNDIHELPVSWTGRVPKRRVHDYVTDEPTHPDV
jgi:hypothetical protein